MKIRNIYLINIKISFPTNKLKVAQLNVFEILPFGGIKFSIGVY